MAESSSSEKHRRRGSMDLPCSFSKEFHLCSICLDDFTDPVTTPCGHNFCQSCLTLCWENSPHCHCPLCQEEFTKKPELKINTTLREVADHFKKKSSPGIPEILCDACTGEKLKALKSCLDCVMTLCKSHLEPHCHVPRLKKHKLINPVENLEDYIFPKHDRALDLFWRDDPTCACQFCSEGDHKNHNIVPIEESRHRKTQLVKSQTDVQQMIEERLEKIKEIKHSIELSTRDTEKQKADSVEIFTALIRSIERSQAELLQVMEEKQKAAERQAEGLIKDLEQEITELKRRDTLSLSHTEDHLHLLQINSSVYRRPHTKNWTEISINTPTNGDAVRTALSRLQKNLNKKLTETLNEKIKEAVSTELKRIQQYAVCKEQLQCSICLDDFTDLVTTPCGHNFCKSCLTQWWEKSPHCYCPLCQEEFTKKSELKLNTTLRELVKTRTDVHWMIEERLKKIKEIKHSVEFSKRDTEKQKADSVEIFTDLIRSIERSQAELLQVMEEKQKAAERQAEGLIKDLEQEITELKMRDTELEQLSHTEEHLHRLQIYSSMYHPPHIKNWTEISINTPLNGDAVRTALSQHQKNLNEKLSVKMRETVSTELKRIQQYAVDVTLDPDTAHPYLILSADGKHVTRGDKRRNLPDTPQRITQYGIVRGKQSFSSGRFYYEVQVSGKTAWDLGVVSENINRKWWITARPQNGFWTVVLRNENQYWACAGPDVPLRLREKVEKVGVFVDYDEGLVSFYDVKSCSHIYSFTAQSFTHKLYPYFNPCLNDGGKNSAPLIITPVFNTE